MLRACLLSLSLLTALVVPPALAQQAPAAPKTATAKAQPQSPAEQLENFYDRLADTKEASDADPFVSAIEGLWQLKGGDTAWLLGSRAQFMLERGQNDKALGLLDSLIDVAPDFAEAYYKRATLYIAQSQFVHAMLDLRETLKREPRHFRAWATLGRILEQNDYDFMALNAYRRALAVNPHMGDIKSRADHLAAVLRGQVL